MRKVLLLSVLLTGCCQDHVNPRAAVEIPQKSVSSGWQQRQFQLHFGITQRRRGAHLQPGNFQVYPAKSLELQGWKELDGPSASFSYWGDGFATYGHGEACVTYVPTEALQAIKKWGHQ